MPLVLLEQYSHNDSRQLSKSSNSHNPAWAYLNVLMGAPSSKALRFEAGEFLNDKIDLEAFRRWALVCASERFTFEHIFTGYSTIGEALQMIAAAGRAKPTYVEGRHSIMFDGDPAYFTGSATAGTAKAIGAVYDYPGE